LSGGNKKSGWKTDYKIPAFHPDVSAELLLLFRSFLFLGSHLLVTSDQFLVGLVDVAEKYFAVRSLNPSVCVKKIARMQIIFCCGRKYF
jgi:hypothetical protein